jgi:hypothetical protein
MVLARLKAPPAAAEAGKGYDQPAGPTGRASRRCLFLHEMGHFAEFGNAKGYGVFAKPWVNWYGQPSTRPNRPPGPGIGREKGPGMIGSDGGNPELVSILARGDSVAMASRRCRSSSRSRERTYPRTARDGGEDHPGRGDLEGGSDPRRGLFDLFYNSI